MALFLHRNGEAGIRWHLKALAFWSLLRLLAAIQHIGTSPAHDLHAFRCFRAEVVGAGENHPKRLPCAICEKDGVGNNFSIEVDIPFGERGDVFKLHGGEIAHEDEVRKINVREALVRCHALSGSWSNDEQ